MRTSIDEILAAEEEAKRRIADAHQQAQAVRKSAEARGEKLCTEKRAQAQAESDQLLKAASVEAEAIAQQIMREMSFRAEKLLLKGSRHDLTFLSQEIDRIAGVKK